MYEMKPEYYIGIDMIDEEHKQLFKYADEAYELLHDEFTPDKYDRIDIILENLRNYTVKHFSDEEQYMESINYKKIFTQKVQHQEFIHKLDEFMEHHNDEVEDQDEQIMGILKYLTEWLVNHILYVDGQIPKGWYSKKDCYFLESSSLFYFEYKIWHIEDDRREARQSMLDAYPSLQNMYSADDGNTEVFYLKNATATFSSFTHEPKVVKF